MMTLEAIRNVEFTRGRGYRAEEVDEFIDNCAETVEELIKENDELNRKMKMLADKVVEYRNDEDNIRSALLNAQRAGEAVLRDAREKAEAIRKESEEASANIRQVALDRIEEEKKELLRVQNEVSAFKTRMLSLYKEHLTLIQNLPETEEKAETSSDPAGKAVVDPATEEPAAPVVAEDGEAVKTVSRFSDLKFGNDYDVSKEEDEDEENHGFFNKKH